MLFTRLLKKLLPSAQKKPSVGGHRQKQPVSANLDKVLEQLKQCFGNTSDLVLRKVVAGGGTKPALVVYLDNMADTAVLNEGIIAKLQEAPQELVQDVRVLSQTVIAVAKISITSDFNKIIHDISYGNTAIFLAGSDRAIIAGTVGWKTRAIERSNTQVNIEGPQDAFVENIADNLTLVRRRIRDNNLRFENMTVGARERARVVVGHIEGLADPGILAEVKRRINTVEIDGMFSPEYLQEYIKDNKWTPFSTIMKSERPEKIVACLLEGRIAVFIDNYPFVSVMPVSFAMSLQAGDDYYQSFYYGTFLRFIRYFAVLVTLLLPSFYIALITHHWEMMPTILALSILAGREGITFPPLIEALAMEFTFEILREAGIRLPKAVGQAVSIVGALVIGQSAVQAGLVSPSIVIVVAFTGIASFAIPDYHASIPMRLLRFPLIIAAGLLGIPGLVGGLLMIWGHMVSLTSFGVPYMTPFMPLQVKDLKDTIFRFPRWAMINRPQGVPDMDPDRTGDIELRPGGNPLE